MLQQDLTKDAVTSRRKQTFMLHGSDTTTDFEGKKSMLQQDLTKDAVTSRRKQTFMLHGSDTTPDFEGKQHNLGESQSLFDDDLCSIYTVCSN